MLLETVAAVAVPASNRLLHIIADADLIIKATLLVLVGFSVASWAIIALKWSQLRAAKSTTEKFLAQFWQIKSIDAFLQRGKFVASPALTIFKNGMAPLQGQGSSQLQVERAAERATIEEIEQLESYVPVLATTASATPFIGLFGTVWGILNAFFDLSAAQGASSLQIVGPRIAEALFTTAVGLVAAIPALVFYNLFASRIRGVARDLEQFATDLSHRVAAEYFKG